MYVHGFSACVCVCVSWHCRVNPCFWCMCAWDVCLDGVQPVGSRLKHPVQSQMEEISARTES